jgi:hypothetical protein
VVVGLADALGDFVGAGAGMDGGGEYVAYS